MSIMKKFIFIYLVLFNGFASAAIFQVDLTVLDLIDDNPGDGVCDIPTGGFCTLRAAVMEANALPGPDIIVLPGDATIRLTITGSGENSAATGDLDITDAVVIGTFIEPTASFPTIDANELNDRVFHVLSGSGLVTFVNFRVINGSADFGNGGAINISLDNQVVVNRVWFEDNTADSGGAIYLSPQSDLDVVDSVFTGNAAVSRGGALTVFGTAQVDKSSVFDNLNFNTGFQEAIYVGKNTLGADGFVLRNSTVFDNSESGIVAVAADLRIRNSTIAFHSNRGVVSNPDDDITPDLRIQNSIFNGNSQNCGTGVVNKVTDNWNITSDSNFCYEVSPGQDSTTLTEDPKLTSLKVDAENWHRYYRPGFFSPVVDSAHPTAPGPGIGCDLEDQRGVVRPQDAGNDGNDRCDRGAIELLEDVIFFDDLDIQY